jgi:hypothetical protein
MYDNACDFLAETFPSDFASWLFGKNDDKKIQSET